MRLLPSSPRARRRFIRLGIALAVVGAVAAIAALVRSPKQPSATPSKNAPPAQLVKQSTHVSPADRRAIDRTLDQFVPAALSGASPATAWRLSGPQLKGGTTLRQWRNGTSPIPHYPARGTTFHNWTTVDAGKSYVDFNLLIHPKHKSDGSSEVFSGQMIKRNGRWLVNGLYTIAVFAKPDKHGRHELGPADFAAGQGSGGGGQSAAPPTTGSGRLGTKWLFVVGGVILLALMVPLGFGVAAAIRSRRARKRYVRSEPRTLPPLPRTSQQTPSEPPAGVGAGEKPR
jgi:hypothetical protein